MKGTFSLDRIRVERRPLAAGKAIALVLPFPAGAPELWRRLAAKALKRQAPGRITGAVAIALSFEDRAVDAEKAVHAILALLVHEGVIVDCARPTVRDLRIAWDGEKGVRVHIAPLPATRVQTQHTAKVNA
jgi:hypothetical protein